MGLEGKVGPEGGVCSWPEDLVPEMTGEEGGQGEGVLQGAGPGEEQLLGGSQGPVGVCH